MSKLIKNHWSKMAIAAVSIAATMLGMSYNAGQAASAERMDIEMLKTWQTEHKVATEKASDERQAFTVNQALMAQHIVYVKEKVDKVEVTTTDILHRVIAAEAKRQE